MTIIFYDINLLNQKKYIGEIINRLILDRQNDIIVMYDEYNEEGFKFFLNKRCKVVKNTALSYTGMRAKLLYYQPNVFVVNAQRLSDTAYVTVAKSLMIKTMMIQHGMYIPFLKRERFYLFKKIHKTFKYFLYSQVIAKTLGYNGVLVFRDFYKTFISGEIYKKSISYTSKINVDNVLVYGEYWKKYHNDIFGYESRQQHIIGYHELNKVNEIREKPFEKNAVCYIAQTLMEDGRLDKETIISFIKVLSKIADTKKVYIKLHPRSDKSLYADERFILLEKDIPNVSTYLGHYSSLIALLGHLDGQIVLYEIKGHTIPFYFKDFSNIVSTYDEIFHFVNSQFKINNKSEIIEKYFSKSFSVEKVIDIMKKLR